MTSINFGRFPAYTAYPAVVPIVRVACGAVIHRYIDTSPISPSGRYLAVFRLPHEEREPAPGDRGEVLLVDLVSGEERVVAQSAGWELQVGAGVQWGPTDDELYFNDVDVTTWRPYAVCLNPATGARRHFDGTVYQVSRDGRTLASHNLTVSRRAQRGYGVVLPEEHTPRNQGPVDHDGIFVTDVATGRTRLLVSIREIYERARPSLRIPNPEEHEYYVFTLKWNPQGTRLFAILQWSIPDPSLPDQTRNRRKAVVTMRADGSDLRVALPPDRYAGGHHPLWTPDGDHIVTNLTVGEGAEPQLGLVRVRFDGTGEQTLFVPGSGHPSTNPVCHQFMVTDAYPRESVTAGDGTTPIRLIDLGAGRETEITRVNLCRTAADRRPDAVRAAYRVDAHPAWDDGGRYLVFNGVHENTRAVFVADLAGPLGLGSSANPNGDAVSN